MSDIEKSSGNVYADLDSPDATEMQIKARLAGKISDIIKQRHLTQQEAAEILGISQPKLSGLLRGQFRGISESKMLECLNRLGRDVEIVVKKASRIRLSGKTSVVFS
jgi:predicted XRE-type DNA-binding protein